jgi:phosphoribosyl-AMP cyclohydrolase
MFLEASWLTGWTGRLRDLPGHCVLAVYLRGSHAQGTATPFSDIDFDVIVDGPTHHCNPAWLVEQDGRLRHVSVAVADVAGFLREEMGRPAKWAFGWPVRSPIRPLWIDESRPDLLLHELTCPPGEPLLEDAIEDFSKICSALASDSHRGVRIAAADLATEIPTLLRLANPPRTVASRAEAWAAVFSLPVAPDGFAADLELCLGWRPGDPARIAAAAHRLIAGTVDLIRPHANAFHAYGDLADAIADGRLSRYLRQLAHAAITATSPTRSPMEG